MFGTIVGGEVVMGVLGERVVVGEVVFFGGWICQGVILHESLFLARRGGGSGFIRPCQRGKARSRGLLGLLGHRGVSLSGRR